MKTLTTALLVLISSIMLGQIAWINEFHYDNYWSQVGEMVEVVVRDCEECELPLYKVELYDGTTGRVYSAHTLDEFTPGDTLEDSRIFYHKYDTVRDGCGGIALSYDSVVIEGYSVYSQFISYGGIIRAVDGAAKYQISHDIGLIENTTTPHSTSIQLSGEHFIWWGFIWEHGVASMGAQNDSQIITEAPMVLIRDIEE